MKCYCDECVFNLKRICVNDDDDIWITDNGECALCQYDDYIPEGNEEDEE